MSVISGINADIWREWEKDKRIENAELALLYK